MKEFLSIYKHGMLPRGELFSLYYPQLLREMIALFKLFYHAKDFEIFFKTALWAKNNINEAQYTYALYSAVIRRPDTKFIQLPPIYEICPYFFFNSEVLQKANHALIFGKLGNIYVFVFNLIFEKFIRNFLQLHKMNDDSLWLINSFVMLLLLKSDSIIIEKQCLYNFFFGILTLQRNNFIYYYYISYISRIFDKYFIPCRKIEIIKYSNFFSFKVSNLLNKDSKNYFTYKLKW